ncbi:hypothetical protein Cni_G25562 [Canna indica]|uniref:Uncharacterized protein n=1 Tax=Canna indica TaxID=4628 RepID=A0AAQ3KXW2_9LILI|nr:hypothetical protein Cni_G25562 [Canna indica]
MPFSRAATPEKQEVVIDVPDLEDIHPLALRECQVQANVESVAMAVDNAVEGFLLAAKLVHYLMRCFYSTIYRGQADQLITSPEEK